MEIDVIGIGSDITTAAQDAESAEAAGYDGYVAAELNHDPFLSLVHAAGRTSRLRLGTCIAGGFSRSPTTLAQLAWDIQAFSGGRFSLGLGSLVEKHVRHRFAMPWGSPAPRMRELVLAIQAVWDCWSSGGPLEFEGDHYQLTLMPPPFRPEPHPHGNPEILVAAVGPRITEVAGEVADGFISHPFTTPAYLRDHSRPALERGLERRGRTLEDLTIVSPVFVVTGGSEEEMASAAAATRQKIAFYASEPTYRAVLDHHGWGEAQTELMQLAQAGRLGEMSSVVDDAMLAEFAVVAEPDGIADGLDERFGGLVDRISFYTPYASDPAVWQSVLDQVHDRSATAVSA
jgi:probable F420-dependent oxidoreductase